MTLNDWQARLEGHFENLKQQRLSSGAMSHLFALEHGLVQRDISDLQNAIAVYSRNSEPDPRHWLAWVVYATEVRMEGWGQWRPGRKENLAYKTKNQRTDLTPTGLLMKALAYFENPGLTGETFTQALMGRTAHIVRIGENTQGVYSCSPPAHSAPFSSTPCRSHITEFANSHCYTPVVLLFAR